MVLKTYNKILRISDFLTNQFLKQILKNMMIKSVNPYNQKVLKEVPVTSSKEIANIIYFASKAFKIWKDTQFSFRKNLMLKLALELRENRNVYSSLISSEMGMPISQAQGDVEKTAQIVEYYADNAEDFLQTEFLEGNKKMQIRYQPLGVILHIAPWNYPFYLALRPVIPAIMAGNTVILKHASNVPQVSQALNGIFSKVGFPEGVFKPVFVPGTQTEKLIREPAIAMITFIGSEGIGKQVAGLAGQEIKKTVMELGGNDPFIVLKDAKVTEAAKAATFSRLRNQGQSCNAAKRFIVEEEISQQFLTEIKTLFQKEIPGDPLDFKTTFGPMASKSAFNEIKRQVEDSVKLGARVVFGGHGDFAVLNEEWKQFLGENQKGYFYPPTILTNITKEMAVYKEEVFGPVASVMVVQSFQEAMTVANDSHLGLGASIWTQDQELLQIAIKNLECGIVCHNSMVRSNIKLPYGGIKKSGYGRELGKEGIKEFVNIKSVVLS